MATISLATVVRNEEKYIIPFLEHIKWVDEIIVIDNGSTDNTVSLVKRYTQKIYKHPKTDYYSMRLLSFKKATKDWVLVLDVDEYLSNGLKKQIQQVLSKKNIYEVYQITRQNYFGKYRLKNALGKEIKIRLLKKNAVYLTKEPIHTEIKTNRTYGYLDAPILHFGFKNIPYVLKKYNQFAKIETPWLIKKGRNCCSLFCTFKKTFNIFWYLFFQKKGYLDGLYGFFWALFFVYYEIAQDYYVKKCKKINTI